MIDKPSPTPDDLARYHRQTLLPGIGQTGQRRLLASKVLVLGCGALGTVIAETLTRAGVGELVLADRDFIELTNLQRQVLFDEQDLRDALPKAQAARRKLARINSQVRLTAVVDDVNHTNIERLAEGCNVIVDGLDNFDTRFLANDVAVKHAIPYVYGGAVATIGMTWPILPHTPSADTPWEKADLATPCLRCVFDHAPPPGSSPTCDTVGVLAPAAAIIASYQAAETIKILTGNFAQVRRSMLHLDLWTNTSREIGLARLYDAGDCPCCKHRVFDYLAGKCGSATTNLCGRNAVQLTRPPAGPKIDLDELARRLRPHANVTVNRFMLRARLTDHRHAFELTLFTDGRAIVKGTDQPQVARNLYARYVGS